MKTILFTILVFFNISILFAQNQTPEVSNVTFTQRTDSSFIVDIYYDLYDADGDTMTVTMQVSADAGATWDFPCEQISSDVGTNILSGTGKHIVWDFGAEHPQTYSDQIQIKTIADDNYSGFETGTVTDIDGNVYKTVKIGNQWWMAENLRVTHYATGDPIPNVTDNTEWKNLTTGAWCAYKNDDNNIETYGLLYNWYAINDSRNIAPAGWHVPTDEEWKELEMHLGMSQSEAGGIGCYRGTDEGGKMKATGTIENGDGLWYAPNTGATNESGFTALPGGFRSCSYGSFGGIGSEGYWWSATEYSSAVALHRFLCYNHSEVYRGNIRKQAGFSVRCVRD